MVAPGFQLLAGKFGPSHAKDHVEGFGGAVEVCGIRVEDGDIIHADRHGAMVVPADAVAALPELAERVIAREKILLEACKRPGFNAEVLAAALKDSAELH
jgi:regulator of RNase E activity RraA